MVERAARPGGNGIYVGRIGGIPVYLASSWFLLAAVIVVAYGGTMARTYPLSGLDAYLAALAFAVLLALSVLLHELGHGLTARAFGWPVQRINLSLMGGHTSFSGDRATPGRSAVVAVVGPLCNLLLAALCWAGLRLIGPVGLPGGLLFLLAFANAVVGGFNLLPGIPLDGGHAVEALVWKATGNRLLGTRVGALLGGATVVGLLVWLVASGAWHSIASVVIGVTVMAHLAQAAWQAWQGAGFRVRLQRLDTASLSRPVEWVLADQPLSSFVDRAAAHDAVFGVADESGRILGLVDGQAFGAALRSGHGEATARQLSVSLPDRPRLPEHADGEQLFGTVADCPGPGVFVGEDLLPSRIVLQSDLVQALSSR